MIAAIRSEDNCLRAGLSRGHISVATRQRRSFVPSATFEAALSVHQQGRLREAERLYREALKRAPEHAGILHHLGVVKAQQGKLDEAIPLMRRALAVDSESAEISCDLGVALEAAGRHAEAITCYERALALKPDYVDAAFNLGNALRATGRHREAVARFEQALSLRPEFAEAHNNLGNSLHALHRYEEAIACFERALAVRPRWAQAHCNLGVSLRAAGRQNEAGLHYREALRIDPSNAVAHSNLGELLRELGRPEEAADHCRSAIALRPDFAEAHNNLANALQELGRVDEARGAYLKSLEINPRGIDALLNLSDIKTFEVGDTHLETLQSLASDLDALTEEEQMKLHFSLGKAYADLGNYGASFRHLLQGNALKRRSVDYDEAATAAFFERIRTVFTPELIARSKGHGDPSRLPIFVLGMPRSGTTLVEQILASHRKVHGAGEIEDLSKVVRTDGSYPDDMEAIGPERLRELGARYVERLRAYAPTAERIVNKMPDNFFHVGLIHLALPNARIIHTRRNPIDTCVSCFTKLFTGSLPYTYELGELGRYYRRYDELMAHWRLVLPADAMLEVPYEALVEDFEPWARRIVDYCGLEWDGACLAFHETKRPVRTASASQVRRPIFKSSIGRWLAYKDLLEPLIKELPAGSSAVSSAG